MTSMEKLASLLCMLFVLQDCHGSVFDQQRRQTPVEGRGPRPGVCTDMSKAMQCLKPLKPYRDVLNSPDLLIFFRLFDESTRDQVCRDTQEAKECAQTNLMNPSCEDTLQYIIGGFINIQEFVCGPIGGQMLQDMADSPCTEPSTRRELDQIVVDCSRYVHMVDNNMGDDTARCSALESFRRCVVGTVESRCGQASRPFLEELYDLAIPTFAQIYSGPTCERP